MKRLIFLKVEYLDLTGKKINKAKEQEMRTQLCNDSIKQFKKEMKDWLDNKSIKITKEYAESEPQAIIEFEVKVMDEVYVALRASEIVDIIDSFLPIGET